MSTATATPARKVCPITKDHFSQAATPIKAQVEGQGVLLDPKNFSTGSVGYYHSGKVLVNIGGVQVPCQLGVTVTVIGSKELTA